MLSDRSYPCAFADVCSYRLAAFSAAATELKLDPKVADALWTKLASSSTQRIIGGATAPRQDAANVNNWHWSEEDLAPWAKERLTALLVGTAAKGVPDKGYVKVTKLEKCEGEASVSNRKGKRIVAFELKVTFKWEGSVDYDEVSGELILPYVSEVQGRLHANAERAHKRIHAIAAAESHAARPAAAAAALTDCRPLPARCSACC